MPQVESAEQVANRLAVLGPEDQARIGAQALLRSLAEDPGLLLSGSEGLDSQMHLLLDELASAIIEAATISMEANMSTPMNGGRGVVV